MTHVLVFHDMPQIRELLTVFLEEEGFVVTSAGTMEDALMVLRTSLHPLIAVEERCYSSPQAFSSFFENIRDHPDWYGQHRYIALASPSSGDEEALLRTLNVALLPRPYPIEALLALVAEAAVSFP